MRYHSSTHSHQYIIEGPTATIKATVEDVKVVTGPYENSRTTHISQDNWRALVESIHQRLKELVVYNSKLVDAVSKEIGPAPVAKSLEDVWTEYGKRMDVDGAKLWVDQAARYLQKIDSASGSTTAGADGMSSLYGKYHNMSSN